MNGQVWGVTVRPSLPSNLMKKPDLRHAFSVNRDLVGKPSRNLSASASGWQNFEQTAEFLLQHIVAGFAFAPHYRDGYRKGPNFIQAGFLAADFDGTSTIEKARDHAFIRAYSGFLYTTASHSDDEHRFRAVFLLEQSISDGRQWANANLGLAHKLGSDDTIADAARCFFGSVNAEVWRNDQVMAKEVWEDLAQYGSELRAARSAGMSINSAKKLGADELVRAASGALVAIDDLPENASVHCPYHDDRHASAFIVFSRTLGGRGVHCRACSMTYWQRHGDEYDFGAFDRLVLRRAAADARTDEELKGFGDFFPPDPKCTIMSERYLPLTPYEPGITLIKSPKATGKTEYLKRLLQQIRRGEFSSDLKPKEYPKTVLLIGHRRALLREASSRLGLNFYRDADCESAAISSSSLPLASLPLGDDLQPAQGRLEEQKIGLAVCLDSLPSFNESYCVGKNPNGSPRWVRAKPHDLVIIDESEQVLSHLFGGTIARAQGGVVRVYDALKYEIENAKAVIALDADQGMLTAHALKLLRPQDWQSRTRIILNNPVPAAQKRELLLYQSETALRNELLRCIELGERCFVACNSKKAALVIEKIIRTKLGKSIRLRTITSDNSRNPDDILFVQNIREEFLKIQVLICSPSLGTGIDITFPDLVNNTPGGLCKVDHVFGFFYPKVNTHTDMDQQLCRVRNPGSVKVWISSATFAFSSNFDVIRDDLARAYYVPRAVQGRDEDGDVKYNPEDPLLMICTHITAAQRASKNRLIELFRKLREANGWVITPVNDHVAPNKDRSEAQRALWNERASDLLKARSLDEADFMDLCIRRAQGDPLSPGERVEFERNYLEHTFGIPLSYEIIKLNYDCGLIPRAATLQGLTKVWDHRIFQAILEGAEQPMGRLQKLTPPILLGTVLVAAGVGGEAGIDRNVLINRNGLARFVALCARNKTLLEELLGQPLRREIEKNPVRQLNAFLKLAGLKLESVSRRRKAGATTRGYAFEASKFDLMCDLAHRFRDLDAVAKDWHRDRRSAA